MCNTAIQMILILHDSSVLCKLHILDRKLDNFSCSVLLRGSNACFFSHSLKAIEMVAKCHFSANIFILFARYAYICPVKLH